ncbi:MULTISPECIES: DUF1761 domain-containing protein [Rhizobium/Agrobacterium group]|uniref:DUF1761 domain-containing protein n=1 Tax=Rhizobium/Agrobacterium group TaxID=227290 RepID=UPI0012E71C4D|nr:MULTISPECIES: DUF1761 domain-containing protein [Rhizobium/Agrobacterium group]MCF1475087.1 DUF1761 domain-containing protein [Allorhizobium ampelinum]MVA54373.1 DUF1761 family protein [Agrobacterium vitis]NSZ55497.1 DUF1761 domain-containing protein [Agrobacterium vitis]NTA34563.1 DUF1761 domain-containing protein [Agrobacterium vitis]
MVFSAFAQISLWGVLAASAFGFVFGGVYFGALVPKYYAIALGRETMPVARPDMLTILGPFVCNIIMIVTTAALRRMIGVVSLTDALSLGLVIGVGYLLAMCMTIAINPNFPRPFYYTMVNAPYFLVSSLVMSAVLFLLR